MWHFIERGVKMKEYKASANAELRRERFVDICERYKSEDPEVVTKALEDALNEMEGFIHNIIKKRYSTYGKYYEDLVQEGRIGVMQGMKKYDPAKSLPTTYFNVYITHEIVKFIDTEINKTTSHYSANLQKIKRAVNKFEQEGRTWNVQDISVETGIKIETIIQCLRIDDCKNEVYYDSEDTELQIREIGKSPEEQYLENEQLKVLYGALMELTPVQREVIIMKYGLGVDGQLAYKTISEKMDIPIEKIKKIRHEAIRTLKNNHAIQTAFRGLQKESENNIVNRTTISFVPEEIAKTLMSELEDIPLDLSDMV